MRTPFTVVDARTGMSPQQFIADFSASTWLSPEARLRLRSVMCRAASRVGILEVDDSQGFFALRFTAAREHCSFAECREIVSDVCNAYAFERVESRFASHMLEALFEAERYVHGRGDADGVLHEAMNSVVLATGSAIIANALLCRTIGRRRLRIAAPVDTGFGTITFSHGTFELPAPATRYLLTTRSIPCISRLPGERVTPTGAALLVTLRCFGADYTPLACEPAACFALPRNPLAGAATGLR